MIEHSPKFDDVFLSTPSARRATKAEEIIHKQCEISIHALREEGDRYLRYGCDS